MTVESLTSFKELLDILKESGVKVFEGFGVKLVFEDTYETAEEDEELDTRNPVGFSTVDVQDLGIMTEFE